MKKTLIWLHKWLGVVLALFFLMWFASGVVLYYVPFPNLTQTERLAGLAPLQLPGGCCLAAPDAAARAGLAAPRLEQARLGMLGTRPVWRLSAAGEGGAPRWHVIDAVHGKLLAPLDTAQAVQLAEAFSGRSALGSEWLERDQWTVPQGLDAHRPLLKVRLDGGDGLELYVSPGAAEVVRDTRRAERFWNWLGAVPHWIYPTVLRMFPAAWHQVVVWLSIPAVLLAATGLVLGVWQLFLNKSRWIPYRKPWWRWHHITGLVAGVFTFTWMLSGLLSMGPFGVFDGTRLELRARALWAGAAPVLTRGPAAATALAQAAGLTPLELDMQQVAGQAWWRVQGRLADGALAQRLVRADDGASSAVSSATDGAAVRAALPDAAVLQALAAMRPQLPPPQIAQLAQYDDAYYARTQDIDALARRPLPVWRAHWPQDGITVYADPASARIVMQADNRTPYKRWLYHGLHSLDFAPLLARPLLREALVVGLSLLGVALCVTSCVLAWRVLVPKRRRQRPSGVARAGATIAAQEA